MRDIVQGLRRRRSLFAGTIAALVGLIFIVAATVLLIPAISDPPAEFAPAELFTFLIALAVEHLIGNDVRALAAARH